MTRFIEFDTDAKNGVIKIPKSYKKLYFQHLKVVLIADTDLKKRETTPGKTRIKGILQEYKNPKLIKYEKSAWERAVKSKYDHN